MEAALDIKIIKAVQAVRAKAGSLSTDSFNPHGKYRYVSIDSYYKHIVPIANMAGLVWRARELKRETVQHNDKPYIEATYAYDLYVEDAVAQDYMHITVSAPLTGPQTTGIMFSYADKVFMRVAFAVATGEADGDAVQPDEAGRPVKPSTPRGDERPARFEDRDVPEGVDPITGEILAPTKPAPQPADLATGQPKDNEPPIIDTRKVDDKSARMVVEVFKTWMPKIKNKSQLIDWHAENVAAIERLAKIDPSYKEEIKALFNERNNYFKAQESKNE